MNFYRQLTGYFNRIKGGTSTRSTFSTDYSSDVAKVSPYCMISAPISIFQKCFKINMYKTVFRRRMTKKWMSFVHQLQTALGTFFPIIHCVLVEVAEV